MIRAARDGDLAAARRALKDGADVDHRDADGWTAAMWAARRRRLAVFKLLVRKGADLAVRDGLNHHAGDIAGIQFCDRYDHRPNAEKIQWIVLTHPQRDARRQAFAEPARAFAGQLGAAFRGRVEEFRVAYLNSNYAVRTRLHGMQCRFLVFAGGFELWVQNFRARPMNFSYHLERQDNRRHRRRGYYHVALRDLFSPDFPVYSAPRRELEPNARAFCADDRNRTDLSALRLGRFQWLLICPPQLQLRCTSTDLTVIRARLAIIASLFERNTRQVPPPLLPDAQRIASVPADPGETTRGHYLGGSSAPAVECRNCRQPAHRVASLDSADPQLQPLGWKADRIEFVFCVSCSTFAYPSLTCTDYAQQPPRIVVQGDEALEDVIEPLPLETLTLRTGRGSSGARSRLGGRPTWIQVDETPDCPSCDAPMRFLLQLEGFGADSGLLYGFVCCDCQITATLVQSH